MKTGEEVGTAHGLMAGSSMGCLPMLSCSHRFPFPATHSLGLAKLVSKRLDIESLSLFIFSDMFLNFFRESWWIAFWGKYA
jgi:hypothetical protein